VSSRTPARNAVAVPATGPVQLVFTQPVSAATAGNLRVTGSQLGRYLGPVSGGGSPTLTFQPARPFAPGEAVSVSVLASITGLTGTAASKEVYQLRAAAGAGPADFAGGPTVAIGSRAGSVAMADFDGDGDLDLATASTDVQTNTSSLSLAWNDGNATFTPAAAPLAAPGATFAVADMNNDGRPDLVLAGFATVQVLLNTGNGSFAAPLAATTVGIAVYGLTTADFDGDGDQDVVTAGYNSLSVRFNDGAGLLSGGFDSPAATSGGVAVADFDNDGDLDLVTPTSGDYASGTVQLRLNNGSGTFAPGVVLATGPLPNGVAAADLDGDGDQDLLVGGSIGADVRVWLNTGNAQFAAAPALNLGFGNGSAALALADVDGDGDLDALASRSRENAVQVWPNPGNGQFVVARRVAVGNGPIALALGDLDGDGALDLATPNGNATGLSVRLNRIPPPVITSFSPASGPPGTMVTVSGTDFGTATTASVNGLAAAFTVVSGSSMTLMVPPAPAAAPCA